MSPPIHCQSNQPDSERFAEVLASPGGTKYLRPVTPTTEPPMTAARQPEPKPAHDNLKLLISVLTLVTLVVGIIVVLQDKSEKQGSHNKELEQVVAAFKETTKETKESIAQMRDVVFELGRQQAVTNSKLNTLEEWKKAIEGRKP